MLYDTGNETIIIMMFFVFTSAHKMSGYQGSDGKFLPKFMNAQEAMDKGVGNKYAVAGQYKGGPHNAQASLKSPNPMMIPMSGRRLASEVPYKPIEAHSNLVTVDRKFGGSGK